MHGLRTGFKEGLSHNVFAKEIVIMVIKPGDIDIEFTAQDAAIAEFIPIQLLWREQWIGIKSREKRCAVRRGPFISQEIEVFLGIRGSAQGMRKSRPNRLLLAHRPKKSDA